MTFFDVAGERQDHQVAFTVRSVDYPYVRCWSTTSDHGSRTYLWRDVVDRLSGFGLTLAGETWDPEGYAADQEWLRQGDVLRRIANIAADASIPTEDRVEDIKNLAHIL